MLIQCLKLCVHVSSTTYIYDHELISTKSPRQPYSKIAILKFEICFKVLKKPKCL